jgi:DNA-binding PadR family transcriptional regulator
MSARHWLAPQTVPRGFLRLYILLMLSRGPKTGYSIMQWIEEKTEGAWKPGAGTMYPLLKSLQREGLLKVKGESEKGGSKTYSLTAKGTKELEEVRTRIAGVGKKERVMGQLFSELFPGSIFVPMMIRRWRDGMEVLRQKLAEIPEKERTPLLEELRFILGSQLDWIDSQLSSSVPPKVARRRRQL